MGKQRNLPRYEIERSIRVILRVILDSNNCEDKIKHIEIAQSRSRQKGDFLIEEQSVMRSELGKLMWLARIARPGAIYDASAAAQNFANNKPGNCDGKFSLEK